MFDALWLLRSGALQSRGPACLLNRGPGSAERHEECRTASGTRLRPVVAHLGAALGDQAGAALAAGVDPEPVDRYREAVAQADQEIDVRDAPDPPGDRA